MALHLEKAIKKLTGELICLSAQVEESVKLSIKSLVERDMELAEKVIRDDEIIDQKEIDIEEEWFIDFLTEMTKGEKYGDDISGYTPDEIEALDR